MVVTCDGWEQLPHEVEDSDITKVSIATLEFKLCKSCLRRFERDQSGMGVASGDAS